LDRKRGLGHREDRDIKMKVNDTATQNMGARMPEIDFLNCIC
jgi:hypothetical protein